MKKAVQLSALLFTVILVAAVCPASQLTHNISATLMAAQSGPVLLAQAQDPAQQQPATQPQDQPGQNPNQMQQPDANGANPPTKRLPKTASPLPMFGLLGLISIGGIIVVRRISRTIS